MDWGLIYFIVTTLDSPHKSISFTQTTRQRLNSCECHWPSAGETVETLAKRGLTVLKWHDRPSERSKTANCSEDEEDTDPAGASCQDCGRGPHVLMENTWVLMSGVGQAEQSPRLAKPDPTLDPWLSLQPRYHFWLPMMSWAETLHWCCISNSTWRLSRGDSAAKHQQPWPKLHRGEKSLLVLNGPEWVLQTDRSRAAPWLSGRRRRARYREKKREKKVMFNLQAEIKGPGSAKEAGNMKGDDVIVHTQSFLIVSFFPPRSRRGLFSEWKYRETRRRNNKKKPEGEDGMQMRRVFTCMHRCTFVFHWMWKFRLKQAFHLTRTDKANPTINF